MQPQKATELLESIDPQELLPYRAYFDTITPRDSVEIFRRFLFAFASVHTGWRANVDLYSLLWDMSWINDKKLLCDRIVESRAGLTEGRTKNIWEFSEKYHADPTWYLKRQDEMWVQYRDRIQVRTPGLGHAKSSFAVELIYPNDSECVCGDTHQLASYGLKGNSSPSQKIYSYVEMHWVSECKRLGIAPVAARWYLWDRKQGHTDSRYWSRCLEGEKPGLVLPRQLELFSWAQTSRVDTTQVPA